MSSLDAINHSALKFLVEAGAVNQIKAIAHADKWSLQVHYGPTDNEKVKTVVAKNSGKVRIWRKLDTLAKYLKDLGISKFEIDVSKYDPSKQTLRRPDSAASLKRTHSAHKKLIEQKAISITDFEIQKSKDSSPTEVRENWEKRRAKILEEANPRAK